MLGKLIKYEFKHTAKTMFMTFAILAMATVMGSFGLHQIALSPEATTFYTVVNIIMIGIYVIAIIGIYCGDFIYLSYHYHQTMYSAQGYLTHTLPVSPAATFGVKILVFFVWMLISSFLAVISVLVLLQIGSGGAFFRSFADLDWNAFFRDVTDLFGMSAGSMLFLSFVSLLFNILWYILLVTASMAIGQLFQKSRTALSILAGFCIYMANQVAGVVFLAAANYNTHSFLTGNLRHFMQNILGGSLVISAFFLILLYGICLFIHKRKLNLE